MATLTDVVKNIRTVAISESIAATEAIAAEAEISKNEAAASAADASFSAEIALSASEYQHPWIEGGEGVVGGTYDYNNGMWMLKQALSNITSQTPFIGSDYWYLVSEEPLRLPCEPTLDWDFVKDTYTVYTDEEGFIQEPISKQCDFTRSSIGSFVNPRGGVKELGVNKLRRTFDGETGESLGALIEEQRTNLLPWSEDFSQSYYSSLSGDVTRELSDVKAPDGTLSAYKISDNGGGYLVALYEISPSTTFRSIYARTVSGTGTVSLLRPNVGNEVFLTEEWTRFEVAGDDSVPYFYLADFRAGDLDEVLIWGAQLEQGYSPTSYIKTEGTAVTRTADNLSRALGDEFNSDEFTLYLEDFSATSYGSLPHPLRITGNAYITMLYQNNTVYFVYSSGNVYIQSAVSISSATPSNIALSVRSGNATLSVNGTTRTTSINRVSENFTSLSIGRGYGVSTSRVAIFPRAFDEETLQQLTRQGL